MRGLCVDTRDVAAGLLHIAVRDCARKQSCSGNGEEVGEIDDHVAQGTARAQRSKLCGVAELPDRGGIHERQDRVGEVDAERWDHEGQQVDRLWHSAHPAQAANVELGHGGGGHGG